MTVHNVDINVNANTAGAEKSLSYLKSLMGEFGKEGASRLAGMLGAAAVAKMAFDKVSEAISANIQTAKEVSRMAIKFNIDPSSMHSITMAAKDAGVSVRALTMSMKALGQYAGKALVSKDLQVNFKQLGIEADKLNEIQAKPSKFLPEIAKSLMEIGDENQRSAAGAALLGRQYQQLLPLIEELGASEEARKKFLDNENAMSEEQIAANKEIAEIQNDLSDGFEKMVASVAPLLLWAMNFVNLLAQGLGFIKDMIFESDEAKKERETKSSAAAGQRIENYQSSLKAKQEAGTLSDEEKKGIEEAGGSIEGYVGKQVEKLDKSYAAQREKDRLTVDMAMGYSDERKQKQAEKTIEAQNKIQNENKVDDNFQKALGIHKSQEGQMLGFGAGFDEQAERHYAAQKDVYTAGASGDLSKIAKEGVTSANKAIRGKKDAAAEVSLKKDLAKYYKAKKTQAALLGLVYDPASDEMMSKSEYSKLQESRGKDKASTAIEIKSFEEESARVKREKAEKTSTRGLAASERKLYAGDPKDKVYRENLTEVEKAQDAVTDSIEAQVGPLEDLADQIEVVSDLERELGEQQELDPEAPGVAANILRLEMQISAEQMKQNDLQSKANGLKAQQIAAQEALRRAKEKEYMEELKHLDEIKNRQQSDADAELQLKYKIMKVQGSSSRDIQGEKLTDEQMRYTDMLKEYKDKFKEFRDNAFKGDKGEALNEDEKKQLEALTKKLDEQKKTVLNAAFDYGNQEDKGQVTAMRRIGGGGLEYGGLQNTALQSLGVARQQLRATEEMLKVMINSAGYQFSARNPDGSVPSGRTFAEVMPDGSPNSR
jgi:hypothetical protein